jgi:enoyl-CoA hydratase/carnithine racemase
MTIPEITTTRGPSFVHLELNRPSKRNALTAAMYAALADAMADAEQDPAIRSVILSGAGASFCAGNDLADFVAAPPAGDDAPVFRFIRALTTAKKSLIAAVHGKAIGIGTTMLLHCDFVFVEPNAEFRMPFVDLALVPEAASSLLMPRLVGQRRAAELLLLGEAFTAEDAVAMGIANRVVDAGQALTVAQAVAARLAAKPAGALLATKALMKSASQDVLQRIGEENAAFVERLKTPELRNVVETFFHKRA